MSSKLPIYGIAINQMFHVNSLVAVQWIVASECLIDSVCESGFAIWTVSGAFYLMGHFFCLVLSCIYRVVPKMAPPISSTLRRPFNCIVLMTLNIVKGAPHISKLVLMDGESF
jgi:hypothetical protein